jgi:cadmium resistance protein CadD (predicted permease)
MEFRGLTGQFLPKGELVALSLSNACVLRWRESEQVREMLGCDILWWG